MDDVSVLAAAVYLDLLAAIVCVVLAIRQRSSKIGIVAGLLFLVFVVAIAIGNTIPRH